MPNRALFQQILSAMQSGANPEQLAMSMLQGRVSRGNPIFGNLLSLAQNHDERGLEQFARNIVSESGADFDKEFNAFKHNLGLK